MVITKERATTQTRIAKTARPLQYWQQQVATIMGNYTEPEASPVLDIFADAGLSMIKRTATSQPANEEPVQPSYRSGSSGQMEYESIMGFAA